MDLVAKSSTVSSYRNMIIWIQTGMTALPLKNMSSSFGMSWAPVNEINLSYHNKETLLFTIDPYYGNLI